MKPRYLAASVIAALGLGLAAAAIAHPGGLGRGMGPGRMGQGPAGISAVQSLMTPEERTALQEKMRGASTPEERQQLAQATRAEMQKRAREKGITLPEPHGPAAGFGPSFAPPFATPNR